MFPTQICMIVAALAYLSAAGFYYEEGKVWMALTCLTYTLGIITIYMAGTK